MMSATMPDFHRSANWKPERRTIIRPQVDVAPNLNGKKNRSLGARFVEAFFSVIQYVGCSPHNNQQQTEFRVRGNSRTRSRRMPVRQNYIVKVTDKALSIIDVNLSLAIIGRVTWSTAAPVINCWRRRWSVER